MLRGGSHCMRYWTVLLVTTAPRWDTLVNLGGCGSSEWDQLHECKNNSNG